VERLILVTSLSEYKLAFGEKLQRFDQPLTQRDQSFASVLSVCDDTTPSLNIHVFPPQTNNLTTPGSGIHCKQDDRVEPPRSVQKTCNLSLAQSVRPLLRDPEHCDFSLNLAQSAHALVASQVPVNGRRGVTGHSSLELGKIDREGGIGSERLLKLLLRLQQGTDGVGSKAVSATHPDGVGKGFSNSRHCNFPLSAEHGQPLRGSNYLIYQFFSS